MVTGAGAGVVVVSFMPIPSAIRRDHLSETSEVGTVALDIDGMAVPGDMVSDRFPVPTWRTAA